jgi:hypothetical protein
VLKQAVYIVTTGLYRLDIIPYFEVCMNEYLEGCGSNGGGNKDCDAV